MVHPPNGRAALPVRRMSAGIDRVGAGGFPTAPSEATAPRDDGGFAALLAGNGAVAAGPAVGAAPSATLSGVAWLQAGVADALAREARDKEARRHGRAMLQALGKVQLAVLGGDDGQARCALAALACTAGSKHEADDPVLQLILREIAVRAAVELARDEATKGDFATDVSNA
jgi:hypothetical protein